MKNWIKGYLTFASLQYRLLVYLVLPLVITGATVFLRYTIGGMGIFFPVVMMVGIEAMADFFLFGGLASKESCGIEYLKTSHRGNALFCNTIWIDAVRRGIWMLLVSTTYMLIESAIAAQQGVAAIVSPLEMLVITLIGYTITELCITVARFFSLIQWYMLFMYAAEVVLVIVYLALYLNGLVAHGLTLGIAALAAVLSTVLSVRILLWRWKGSYYDEKPEK